MQANFKKFCACVAGRVCPFFCGHMLFQANHVPDGDGSSSYCICLLRTLRRTVIEDQCSGRWTIPAWDPDGHEWCSQDVWAVSEGGQLSIDTAPEAAAAVPALLDTATAEQQNTPREMPCSAAQLAMLAQGARLPGPHVFVFRLLGTFVQAVLQEAINTMVSLHEALRTHIVQLGAARPWLRVDAASEGNALEAAVLQHPGGLYDVDDTEAGSMPGWIEEAVASLQQATIPLDKAPLAAINLYEVCSATPHPIPYKQRRWKLWSPKLSDGACWVCRPEEWKHSEDE